MPLEQILTESLRVAFGAQGAAFALAAVGLNLHFGYTGLLNFGHVGFFLVGAYGSAITVDNGGSLWLGIGVGLLAAVVFALILGIPTLRLRADYLAIVTIAASEILRLVVRSSWARPVTGGVFGLQSVVDEFYDLNPVPRGRYGFSSFIFSEVQLWVVLVGWSLAILATVLIWRLVKSPWGRALKAIREDEDAARALGKNAFALKLQSLVIGGMIGSLAGVVLLFNSASVTPDVYIPQRTFFVYAIVILGGAGTIMGPLIGALLFWFIIEFTSGLLRDGIERGWLPEGWFELQDVAAIRFILVGAMLMALMTWRPQGLLGSREELLLDDR